MVLALRLACARSGLVHRCPRIQIGPEALLPGDACQRGCGGLTPPGPLLQATVWFPSQLSQKLPGKRDLRTPVCACAAVLWSQPEKCGGGLLNRDHPGLARGKPPPSGQMTAPSFGSRRLSSIFQRCHFAWSQQLEVRPGIPVCF